MFLWGFWILEMYWYLVGYYSAVIIHNKSFLFRSVLNVAKSAGIMLRSLFVVWLVSFIMSALPAHLNPPVQYILIPDYSCLLLIGQISSWMAESRNTCMVKLHHMSFIVAQLNEGNFNSKGKTCLKTYRNAFFSSTFCPWGRDSLL